MTVTLDDLNKPNEKFISRILNEYEGTQHFNHSNIKS